MTRQNLIADVRPYNNKSYDDTTALTIKMTHDQAQFFRALLSQGTKASDTENAEMFRSIKNKLTHVRNWQARGEVAVNGAAIKRAAKPLPTVRGTVFKARVASGWDTYEGDVFVAVNAYGDTVYVTPRAVNETLAHSKSKVTAL